MHPLILLTVSFRFNIKKVRKILQGALKDRSTTLPSKYYFNGYECCQLIADYYSIPITIIQKDQESRLFIPSSLTIMSGVIPIVLKLENLHYELYDVRQKCIYPPLHPVYLEIFSLQQLDDFRKHSPFLIEKFRNLDKIQELIEIE